MKCRICRSSTKFQFEGEILKKYIVKYYYCEMCGFLQTEEPYWLDEAYSESISKVDTGIMSRNNNQLKFSTLLVTFFFNKSKVFLDYGGGYGIYVRLMRDIGFDFYWKDKYSSNLFAKGFESKKNDRFDLITSFETLEHFVDPGNELEEIFKLTNNLLVTTDLFSEKHIPKFDEWHYYAPEAGQHISFYSIKTLKYLAYKFDANLYTNNRNIHILSKEKLSKTKLMLILLFKTPLFFLFNIFNKNSLIQQDYQKMRKEKN